MNYESENVESSSTKLIQALQPIRDLELNWGVDLAKNLEEYLLKICSGEISGNEDALTSINFAEAALLLQGSVQVYSRKVEYLYSLVLHALEFLSQKSQEDQSASTSAHNQTPESHIEKDEENDPFWCSDDIPVEANNLLDNAISKDVSPSHFVRPPANLVVLEGDCFDGVTTADGELESYLLATNNVYRDFILLDSCDAVSVDNYINCNAGSGPRNVCRGSSLTSKGNRNFRSPSRRSGGTFQTFSAGKKNEANISHSLNVDHAFEPIEHQNESFPHSYEFPIDDGYRDGYSEPGDPHDSDDDEDPWEPLNPHEPGNLKVKPYKKVKASGRLRIGPKKVVSIATKFPLAKLQGPIDTWLNEIWKAKFGAFGTSEKPQLSLYEKLRNSMLVGEKKENDYFHNPEENGSDDGDLDTGPQDFDMPDDTFNNEDVMNQKKHHDFDHDFVVNDSSNDPITHESLEDLCRSHLDALLATLADTEKQTELAVRVSTWKQRIEQNLEEQDALPSFDIHMYGDKVLDKLSVEGNDGNALSFGDVVKGQEKHDVARTFSALLQLVNNGDVDLLRSTKSASVCYSNLNLFHVRLLKNERKRGILLQSSKKRAKTPLVKGHVKIKRKNETFPAIDSSPRRCTLSSSKLPISNGKESGLKRTPQGKKRRKSQDITPLGMPVAGWHDL